MPRFANMAPVAAANMRAVLAATSHCRSSREMGIAEPLAVGFVARQAATALAYTRQQLGKTDRSALFAHLKPGFRVLEIGPGEGACHRHWPPGLHYTAVDAPLTPSARRASAPPPEPPELPVQATCESFRLLQGAWQELLPELASGKGRGSFDSVVVVMPSTIYFGPNQGLLGGAPRRSKGAPALSRDHSAPTQQRPRPTAAPPDSGPARPERQRAHGMPTGPRRSPGRPSKAVAHPLDTPSRTLETLGEAAQPRLLTARRAAHRLPCAAASRRVGGSRAHGARTARPAAWPKLHPCASPRQLAWAAPRRATPGRRPPPLALAHGGPSASRVERAPPGPSRCTAVEAHGGAAQGTDPAAF